MIQYCFRDITIVAEIIEIKPKVYKRHETREFNLFTAVFPVSRTVPGS